MWISFIKGLTFPKPSSETFPVYILFQLNILTRYSHMCSKCYQSSNVYKKKENHSKCTKVVFKHLQFEFELNLSVTTVSCAWTVLRNKTTPDDRMILISLVSIFVFISLLTRHKIKYKFLSELHIVINVNNVIWIINSECQVCIKLPWCSNFCMISKKIIQLQSQTKLTCCPLQW